MNQKIYVTKRRKRASACTMKIKKSVVYKSGQMVKLVLLPTNLLKVLSTSVKTMTHSGISHSGVTRHVENNSAEDSKITG